MSSPYWTSTNPLYIPDGTAAFQFKDSFSNVQNYLVAPQPGFPNSGSPMYWIPGAPTSMGGITQSGGNSWLNNNSRFCLWVKSVQFRVVWESSPVFMNIDLYVGTFDTAIGALYQNGLLAHIAPYGSSASATLGSLAVQPNGENTFDIDYGIDAPLLIGGGIFPTAPNNTYTPTLVFGFHGAAGSWTMSYNVKGFIAQTGPY